MIFLTYLENKMKKFIKSETTQWIAGAAILIMMLLLSIINNKVKATTQSYKAITIQDMDEYVRHDSSPTFKEFYIYTKNKGY